MKQNGQSGRRPSWWVAIIPFAALAGLMTAVVSIFNASALDGASQVSLLLASAITVAIATLGYGVKWQDIDEAISTNIKTIGSASIILLLIGAISGSWMVSGIVPTLIYYGLKILSPSIFLFAACLICALVSVVTGSSWTTIATIGVALIGIGMALGFSAPWTAGAIISGAYFGDKISPLSDTTVLASSVTETPLFDHIRYLMVTTIPSFVIACLVFLAASLFHDKGDIVQTSEVTSALASSFNLSPWLLVVPLVTGFLIWKKLPAMLTLFLSALMAIIAALIFQTGIIAKIGGTPQGSSMGFSEAFRGMMVTLYGSTAVQTGNGMLDALVGTSGMCGMLNTIFLILCAATFGGTLTGSGMIQSLTEMLTRRIRRRTSLVSSTVATGIFANMVTGDQYLAIILTSSLYKKLYRDKGYEGRLLSRSCEDSATVTSVLIPWDSCGMTQATVLRVATLDYLPYCFFNLLSPLMSILVAALGYKIIHRPVSEV